MKKQILGSFTSFYFSSINAFLMQILYFTTDHAQCFGAGYAAEIHGYQRDRAELRGHRR